MRLLLYSDLVAWYSLIDPHEDHEEEVATYRALFEEAVPNADTLLELGAGAGNNARYFKKHYRCTLTDVSEEMMALSRAQNPDCEHLLGDMRTIRLGRTFDVVMVHDAVCYMTSREDLLAAAQTAFAHTRPGGAAIFAPDCVRETLKEESDLAIGDDAETGRYVRCLMWTWDPDPTDETYVVDFAYLLRDGASSMATPAHERHVEGVFAQSVWEEILRSVGYEVATAARPLEDGRPDVIFVCRRGTE